MGIETTTREYPKNFLTVSGGDLHVYLPTFSKSEGEDHMRIMFKEVATLTPLIAAINQQAGLKLKSIEATIDEKSPNIRGFKEPQSTQLS